MHITNNDLLKANRKLLDKYIDCLEGREVGEEIFKFIDTLNERELNILSALLVYINLQLYLTREIIKSTMERKNYKFSTGIITEEPFI